MVDFHSHILYAVDDGSESFEMSVSMVELSLQEGVKVMALTPHHVPGQFEVDPQEYEEKFERLKEHFEGRMELVPAMEIMVEPHLLEKLQSGRLFGYNRSKTLLVEFDLLDYPLYAEKLFYDLRKLGYQVILAHPERNRMLRNDPEKVYHLIDLGVLCQLNAGSLQGHFGEKTRVFAEKLIEKNLIHAVGSDGHNDTSRNTRIRYAYDRIHKLNPQLHAFLLESGPSLIHGEVPEILDYLPWEEHSPVKKNKSWLSKLWK